MSRSKEIMSFVNKKIFYLQQLEGSSQGNAELACLRRGIGKNPGEMPDLWGILYEDMPENFIGNTDEPSKEEWSCYTALTKRGLKHGTSSFAPDRRLHYPD